MKFFFLSQLLVTLIGGILAAEISDTQGAASFVIGAGLIALNVVSLAFVWFHMIQKKLVALSLTIIVFKYAILGVIIYKLLSLSWIRPGWFCVGLGSLLVSVLVFGLFAPKKDEENG